MHRIRQWLALLTAGLALMFLSSCSQSCQAGTRGMPGAADQIAAMADQKVSTSDALLESGTAAAATHLLKSHHALASGEETGSLSEILQDNSESERYNSLSAPTSGGLNRMTRLFLFPGDWSEDEVVQAVVTALDDMDRELSKDNRDRRITPDSYVAYTYTYAVSVRQAYSDQASAWVVGVGINQTANEEHKT